MSEDALDLIGQAQVARPRNRARLTTRINTGGEQRFGGVDIAHADDHGVIHDEGFDRHAAPARHLEQALTLEQSAQRLRAELAEQLVAQRIFAPQQRAETPRVGVTQRQAGLQLDIHMLMLGCGQATLDQTQTARHTQMTDQTADFGLDQQVLGAALDALDSLAGQTHVQVFGDGPAQTALTHDDAADALTLEIGGDTAAGSFDFG